MPKAIINDALGIILDELAEKLAAGEQVSIKNLGLINLYYTHETSGVNISTGELEPISSNLSVNLVPSDTLLKLLNKRRKNFER